LGGRGDRGAAVAHLRARDRALLALLAALSAPGCDRNPGVSPGRESALVRLFTCEGVGTLPDGVRAVFDRHRIRHREQPGLDTYLAAGVRGPSEYLVQILGQDAKISLYVARGSAETREESAIFEELALAFSSCRPLETIGR
jgi:hypothetical protein